MVRKTTKREPNITCVGPYQYKVVIRIKGYPTVCKTFENIEDARDFRNVTKRAMRRGNHIDTSQLDRITLSELLDRYSREVLEGMKSAAVRRSKVKVIKRHAIAGEVVGNITGMHIAKFRDERLKVVTGSTVRDELTLLHHLFKIARQEWGLPFPGNPVEAVRAPKPNRARDRRLEPGEEARLLAACKAYGGVIHDVVLFALETAMRRGEIAQLRWQDIRGNIARLEDTKNGERRDVPLSTAACRIVARQIRNIQDNRIFGLRSDSIGMAFRRACERAESGDGKKDQPIINLRFHDLRHEATSRLFEKSLSTEQVKLITGHKTYSMLDRYTHLRAEDLAKMLG